MKVQRSTVLLIAAFAFQAATAHAQGAFPAPLPGQVAAPAAPPPMSASAPAQSSFPSPMSGGFSAPPPTAGGFGAPQQGSPPGAEDCQAGFLSLRKEAEAKAAALQAAGKRHAPAQEACKLITAFGQSEVKMIKYIEANTKKCGIPPEVAAQLKKGHATSEQMQNKICTIAANGGGGPAPGPSLSEALGSATLPETKATKRSGGSTFDTLNGNVLSR